MTGPTSNGVPLRQNQLGTSDTHSRQNQQGVATHTAPHLGMRQLKMTDLPFYQVLDVVLPPDYLRPSITNVNPIKRGDVSNTRSEARH
jgi:uncharacterized protein YceK